MSILKIVFAGTPEFGLPCLEALHASAHELIAIYTQPDRPAGRGQKLQMSPIKTWGQAHHLPIYQPSNFKSSAVIDELEHLAPDLMVVIAYGLILPKRILQIPHLGCINVHASLLPRWRGASPIQHALLAGDKETGVTIMQMDTGMDTGPYFMMRTCP
ncbi:MAG TPA: methionyl-tRNA formyltransferase, partial [Legionellaceae bacterium]|nr:methionyl-tRNA formyltransferase [Legionellaceae bacterium]